MTESFDTTDAPREGPGAETKRVRVLHVRNSDRFGGPERLIVEHLARAKLTEPTLASFGAPSVAGRAEVPHPLFDEAKARGLRVALVEQSSSYDPRMVARLRRLIEQTRAQVLVGHDYKANVSLWAAARRSGLPRAAIVHGYTAEDRKVRVFEAIDRRLLRHVTAVVAVSAATRDAIVTSGVPADRVHLVENGIDIDATAAAAKAGRARLRAEWGVGPGQTLVISIGRLSPEKGHAVLLDAFAPIAATAAGQAVLVLVGDGAGADDLRRQAAALAAGSVRFVGWRVDPWACLGAADVFALPSLREGLPLAVLEAMAARVPVVASAVGGVPDALDEGRCGALVPPGDPAALTQALAGLVGDAAARFRLAEAAVVRVRERFGINGQAAALEDLWQSLHRGASRGR
jgi:glycosyltransferase involved in cell wall biosynthesis